MTPLVGMILPTLVDLIKQGVSSIFPNPEDAQKRADAENKMVSEVLARSDKLQEMAAQVVLAEAKSENFLTSTWRPLTMLIFVSLIVARWFGWAAPNLTEAEYLKLWSIVEFGLGGYVVGRSVEKVLPSIAEALGRK